MEVEWKSELGCIRSKAIIGQEDHVRGGDTPISITGRVMFGLADALVLVSVLFLFLATAARGEGLYTRTDELSCGNTVVHAFSTCYVDPEHADDCAEQHFLFVKKTSGAFTRVRASGEPVATTNSKDKRGIWLYGLAWRWACLKGKAGNYVVIDYSAGGNCDTCEWREIFDLTGRRLATSRKSEAGATRFDKEWDSLGLARHSPEKAFVDIKLQK
jgi:hypothetical protein